MCSSYRRDCVPVPLRNRDYLTTLRFLQRFEPCKAAEAHSIQNNLKVKHVWNLASMLGQNMFSPLTMFLPLPHFLQLHQFLTFSCFSKPNTLHCPLNYKNTTSIPDSTAMVDNCPN